MRSTLDELITELTELKTLVKSIVPVNNALSGNKDTLVTQYISIRKRFDYAAFVVALYASFEKFSENLIKEYLQIKTCRTDYNRLPQKLMNKHLTQSAELLCHRRLGEGRYRGMSDLDVVKNLFDCLSGAESYTLNEDALIHHNANLRTKEVDEIFSLIGIEQICHRVCSADAMKAWYNDFDHHEMLPQDSVNSTVIKERLNDIVERRNEIAHGGGKPIELFGSADMRDAVTFIESLAESIYGFVAGLYLQDHYASPENCAELVRRKETSLYHEGKVVVIDKPAHRIFVGQPIFVIVESTGARWGRIQSLQVDKVDKQEIDVNENVPNGIGVGLDFKYPNASGAKFIVLQKDDDVVWKPL